MLYAEYLGRVYSVESEVDDRGRVILSDCSDGHEIVVNTHDKKHFRYLKESQISSCAADLDRLDYDEDR